MARGYRPQEEHEKAFIKLFDKLTYSRTGWQVWEDLMTVMACSISNAIDREEPHFSDRERQYEQSIKALGGMDVPAQIFGEVMSALEDNPNQDFLGKLYMNLNLGNHWNGQFFTPYHVCELMAKMQITEESKAQIEEKGYISIADMCIGGGAMLIAAANTFREIGINYHNHVLFVGQDVDAVVAKMAYIQLSLLGCPGYIAVGNSITHPMTGHPLFPKDREGLEYWYTPFFGTDVWNYRRIWNQMDRIFQKSPVKETQQYFYFYFNKEGENAGRESGIYECAS